MHIQISDLPRNKDMKGHRPIVYKSLQRKNGNCSVILGLILTIQLVSTRQMLKINLINVKVWYLAETIIQCDLIHVELKTYRLLSSRCIFSKYGNF